MYLVDNYWLKVSVNECSVKSYVLLLISRINNLKHKFWNDLSGKYIVKNIEND